MLWLRVKAIIGTAVAPGGRPGARYPGGLLAWRQPKRGCGGVAPTFNETKVPGAHPGRVSRGIPEGALLRQSRGGALRAAGRGRGVPGWLCSRPEVGKRCREEPRETAFAGGGAPPVGAGEAGRCRGLDRKRAGQGDALYGIVQASS